MYKCIDCMTGHETQHSSSGSALYWALEQVKKQVDTIGVTELEEANRYDVYSLVSNERYYKILWIAE